MQREDTKGSKIFPDARDTNLFTGHWDVMAGLYPSHLQLWYNYEPKSGAPTIANTGIDGFCKQEDTSTTRTVEKGRSVLVCRNVDITGPKTIVKHYDNLLLPLNKMCFQVMAITQPPVACRIYMYVGAYNAAQTDLDLSKHVTLGGAFWLTEGVEVQTQFTYQYCLVPPKQYVIITGIELTGDQPTMGETVRYDDIEVQYITRKDGGVLAIGDARLTAEPTLPVPLP